MKQTLKKIVGVIYPIPLQYVDRIFEKQKNVFVKYTSRQTTALTPKHKILFYASHGKKEIVGEAKIKELHFLTPTETWEKYGANLFLNEEELTQYCQTQVLRNSSKKMQVIVLSKPRKYPEGIKYKRPISMSGQYINEEDYQEIIQDIEKRSARTPR